MLYPKWRLYRGHRFRDVTAPYVYAVEVCPLSQSDIQMTVALVLILNCQVNVYIMGKSDLIRHTVSLEVTMKCLRPKYCIDVYVAVALFFSFSLYLVYLVALHFIADGE